MELNGGLSLWEKRQLELSLNSYTNGTLQLFCKHLSFDCNLHLSCTYLQSSLFLYTLPAIPAIFLSVFTPNP